MIFVIHSFNNVELKRIKVLLILCFRQVSFNKTAVKSFYFPFILILSMVTFSCIPIKIAPNFDGGKVFKPKKFKKELPKQYAYVFKDPKDANEFYKYVNAKYHVAYDDYTGNVPILIDQANYYLTFYETERSTETVNLVPIIADAALENKGSDPIFEDVYTSRAGTWYIALTITDNNFGDPLKSSHQDHKIILKYLDALREEYLNTSNYMDVYLRNHPIK